MRVLGATAIAAMLFSAAAANAQGMRAQPSSPLYGELGYTWGRVSGLGLTAKPDMLRGIVGYDVHPNLAVEGMLGVGVNDDKQTVGATDFTSKIAHTAGVYLKPRIDPLPNLELFARLGYADTRLQLAAPAGAYSQTRGSLSYGAGLTYSFGRVYTGLDYMRLYNRDGVKADGVTLSLGYRF